jgi:heme-degrading monooxygenase HmoA
MRSIVIMRFKVADGREKEFESLVEQRARSIKKSPGIKQVYLLLPVSAKDKDYRLVTWWEDLKDHEAWIRRESYEFHHSADHPGIVVGTVPFEVANVVKEW